MSEAVDLPEFIGPYKVIEKIATGGMAEVFLVEGIDDHPRYLALKRILPAYADMFEFIDMFKLEAKLALNVGHANVVRTFAIGESDDSPFLLMEYVAGLNLRQLLNKLWKKGEGISFALSAFIGLNVARALQAIHNARDEEGQQLNIIHRDVCPQNVLLSYDGSIKFIDFGISKSTTELEHTKPGVLKGKFGYMSPEQANGEPITLRTDLFSLGIILWELFNSARLFVAEDEISTLRKIRNCEVPPTDQWHPDIPSVFIPILKRALAPSPDDRFATADEMAQALHQALRQIDPYYSSLQLADALESINAGQV